MVTRILGAVRLCEGQIYIYGNAQAALVVHLLPSTPQALLSIYAVSGLHPAGHPRPAVIFPKPHFRGTCHGRVPMGS